MLELVEILNDLEGAWGEEMAFKIRDTVVMLDDIHRGMCVASVIASRAGQVPPLIDGALEAAFGLRNDRKRELFDRTLSAMRTADRLQALAPRLLDAILRCSARGTLSNQRSATPEGDPAHSMRLASSLTWRSGSPADMCVRYLVGTVPVRSQS